MRVFLLNGLPVSMLVEASEYGIDILEFWIIDKERLRTFMNEAVEVINSIRHQSTKDLVLSLLEKKEKVREVQFISLKEIKSDDIIIIVAPRQLQARGMEQQVNWEDVVIIEVAFRGLPI